MNKHISIIAGFCAAAFVLASCSDDFLEVKNPTGEPLEEYYTTEETLNEALTSAYAPLHWPDWDGTAYNDLTVDGEIMGDDFWVGGSNATDNEHGHKLFNFEGNGNRYQALQRCYQVLLMARQSQRQFPQVNADAGSSSPRLLL